MSRRFMRYVRSVADVQKVGTDTDFYTGPEFVALPMAVTEPVRKWCGENLLSVTLGKEGPEDDPIEVYVLPLDKSTELAALKEKLGNVLAQVIADVAASPPKDVFARNSDVFFDTLRASADVRDFVLRVEGDAAACRRAGTIRDPAILIEA